MIITKAVVHALEIPLLVPYTIAYETITSTTNLFLVLETDLGVKGVGCAAPAPEVTGESATMAKVSLEKLAARLRGMDVEAALEDVSLIVEGSPSANTAVDLALADLAARAGNQSCLEWLGGAGIQPKPVTTSVTIGISSVEETAARARKLVQAGFRFLKIKGGHDVRIDMERLTRIRRDHGPSLLLALDANQGYSLKDVELLERQQAQLSLEYLEQPTLKHDLSMLGEAASRTSVPVMADESVQTIEDAQRIGDLGTIRLLNIKLQKMGGLRPSVRVDKLAEAAGMRTMLGCMDESALSIAAALSFGAAHPNVQYYDLDGHFDLSQDPFEGLVDLIDGQLTTIPQLGLGWSALPDLLFAQ